MEKKKEIILKCEFEVTQNSAKEILDYIKYLEIKGQAKSKFNNKKGGKK